MLETLMAMDTLMFFVEIEVKVETENLDLNGMGQGLKKDFNNHKT